MLQNPAIVSIAARYNKSAAAVVLRWHVQRGVATPPFSLYENELRENLTVGDWELDDDAMKEIADVDKDYHYLRPESWYGLPLWN